jgi:hypothetical protein
VKKVKEAFNAAAAVPDMSTTEAKLPIGYVLLMFVVPVYCPLSVPFEQSMPSAVSTAMIYSLCLSNSLE